MINKDKVIEIAKECGALVYQYNRSEYDYPDEYTFTKPQLQAFAQALEAHIVGEEPVAHISNIYIYKFTNMPPDISWHSIDLTKYPVGTKLYTAPPNYAELKAECERYRKALVEITYSHDGYARAKADEALKGKGE